MAQQHRDTALAQAATPEDLGDADAGTVVSRYLNEHAAAFLRALSLRGEDGEEAGRLLRHSARRISAALHTYAPLTEPSWAEPLRAELGWLSTTLAREHQCASRLARLLAALQRLSLPAVPAAVAVAAGPDGAPADGTVAGQGASPKPAAQAGGPPSLGAARAGALLDRQLTLARTRAHSAALQALGSSRFHALADSVAVLTSEVPLTAVAATPAKQTLAPLVEQAHRLLAEATTALPLARAAQPYNAEAASASLGAELTADLQDAPWYQVRILLRLSRYAEEVFPYETEDAEGRLAAAGQLLERHREAAEAAASVAAAARTPRIAPATAYALGVLHTDQRLEVEAARFAFARLWQRPAPGTR